MLLNPRDVITEAFPVAIAATWLLLLVGLLASRPGRRYLAIPTAERAAEDLRASQPNAIAIAALVFAGLAFISQTQTSDRLPDLLFGSLACFVAQYATGFWPWSFPDTLVRDGLEWTGLALFLAAAYEYALLIQPTGWGVAAVALAATFIIAMSARSLFAHVRSALRYRPFDQPGTSVEP